MLHRWVNQEREKLIPVACAVAAWEVWDYTEDWTFTGLTFFLPLVVLFAVKILRRHLRHKALLESGIDVVDCMSGVEFEELLLAHFRAMGYRGSLTPETGDYGADLILEKAGTRTVVQAKRWKQPVGIEAVQQIIGAMKYYQATKGMVVTNSVYTPNAQELARVNGIELIDREQLIGLLRKSQGKESIKQLGASTASPSRAGEESGILPDEQCPICGRVLVARTGKYGAFKGCSGFPRCHFTRN